MAVEIYDITNKAGRYVAGFKRLPGQTQIELTPEQAGYELSQGTITATGQPGGTPVEPEPVVDSDTFELRRAGLPTRPTAAQVAAYVKAQGGVPNVLLACGPGAPVYGPAANATFFDLMRPAVLPAGVFRPGAALELDLLIEFLAPAIAGRSIQITINGVTIGQSFPVAAIGSTSIKLPAWVSNDGKSLLAYAVNFNDVVSPAAGQGAPFSSHAAQAAASVVDLTAQATIRVQAKPVNGDICRLVGLCLTQRSMPGGPAALLPLNAISCWGDSLTAGSGSTTPAGGWPSRLRQALAGRGVSNFGIGGQTSLQIVERMLADRVMGRNGIVIGWIGRNDVGVVADLTATVMAQHARAVANLAPGASYLPGTITPSSAEVSGSANHTAILAANVAIKAAFPNAIDLFAALATEPNGTIAAANRSDAVHLNDAGYEIVKTTVQSKLTALGL
ncbi:SGNH/GDSL hydrolase family protein [Bosea vaviloviae]|uniref:SGNH hydrolase-type esterase domain-containing protein n=1 Tax=Bosea vaviloviae TaxID=1526658 RepID=A0A0N1F4X5_9HYPH|nr:SGNH/GDSL hydrolase family protein [Bosea vaviloviae]KPH80512.1 hypothetical protein AE618_12045 [Bosea vaviloviae]